jgi:cytidine deaminase
MALGANEQSALIALARSVRERAHAPYSGYAVGASVLGDDDRVFAGCNVENASFGLTLCAERAAMAAAVAGGVRSVRAVVLVAGGSPPPAPCGACLQWLAELGSPDTAVVTAGLRDEVRGWTLAELLPEAFRLGSCRSG